VESKCGRSGLPPSQFRNHKSIWALSPLLGLFLQFQALRAQPAPELPGPPDFDQGAIVAAANGLSSAWTKWESIDAGLERRVFRMPIQQARQIVQRVFDGYLEILEKRRTYSATVSAYIDQSRTNPRPRQAVVAIGPIFEDHVQLLGANLNILERKLAAMRDSPHWIAIRRAVRTESGEAFRLQSARRSNVPLDLSPGHSRQEQLISSQIYRDSEGEVTEVLRRLWTAYYQALVDAVEQTGGTRPLRIVPSRANLSAQPVSGLLPSTNTLVGVWT
jgi:hypothetical protein